MGGHQPSQSAARGGPVARPELCHFLSRLPAAAYICDADGLITYFNERAPEIWGRVPRLNDPRDRFCGAWRVVSIEGDSIEPEQCCLALALKENREYEGHEMVVLRPDGTRRNVLAYARPMHEADGSPSGAVNILWDVTEQKLAEAAVRSAERFKADLLAALAHELRNPLTPLLAGVAIIREASGDRETIEEHCTLMERQLSQLSRLVDDLLNAHRLSERTLRLRRSRIPLASVVRTAVEENRALIARSGHVLSVTLPATPIFVDADPSRLGQAIGHLLSNAAKHMPDGGRIELSVERDAGLARLSLRDNGIGIPADRLDSIFNMFSRLDRSLETGYNGLGLGLALVKALVELHGGTVQAVSDGPGRGSEFRLSLPLAREEATASPPPASELRRGRARRVLLVDDNRDVARSLSRLVRILGHDVRVAYDGTEAIRVADEFRPEVVVMDIGLPGLNGYDAARALRARHGRAVTLVALTGFGGDMHACRSRDAGFDRHLTKPIEARELEDLLGRAVASAGYGGGPSSA